MPFEEWLSKADLVRRIDPWFSWGDTRRGENSNCWESKAWGRKWPCLTRSCVGTLFKLGGLFFDKRSLHIPSVHHEEIHSRAVNHFLSDTNCRVVGIDSKGVVVWANHLHDRDDRLRPFQDLFKAAMLQWVVEAWGQTDNATMDAGKNRVSPFRQIDDRSRPR